VAITLLFCYSQQKEDKKRWVTMTQYCIWVLKAKEAARVLLPKVKEEQERAAYL